MSQFYGGYSSNYIASYPYLVCQRSFDTDYARLYYADPDEVPGNVVWTSSQKKAQHYYREEAHRIAAKLDAIVVRLVPRPTSTKVKP